MVTRRTSDEVIRDRVVAAICGRRRWVFLAAYGEKPRPELALATAVGRLLMSLLVDGIRPEWVEQDTIDYMALPAGPRLFILATLVPKSKVPRVVVDRALRAFGVTGTSARGKDVFLLIEDPAIGEALQGFLIRAQTGTLVTDAEAPRPEGR
jgi:hypothetical protein